MGTWFFFFTYWYTNILAILYIDIENLLKFYSYVKHTGGVYVYVYLEKWKELWNKFHQW